MARGPSSPRGERDGPPRAWPLLALTLAALAVLLRWRYSLPRHEGRCASVLFAAHDPGAQNDIRPLHDAASAHGLATTWLDLRAEGILLKGSPEINLSMRAKVARVLDEHAVCLCVTGFSTNWAEVAVADECARARSRARPRPSTLTVVLFLAGMRMEGAPRARRHHWLMGSAVAAEELRRRHRIPASRLHVTGSAYLESFRRAAAARPPPRRRARLLELYGARRGAPTAHLVSCFVSAPDGYVGGMAGAAQAVAPLVRDTCNAATALGAAARGVAVVVRPHPRSPPELLRLIDAAVDVCGGRALVDAAGDLESLVRASSLVLAHGSTTLVESVLLGVPAAYYKRSHDDAVGEGVLGSVSPRQLPRLRTADELEQLLAAALALAGGNRSAAMAADLDGLEGHVGATERQWEVLQKFL